MSLNLLRKTDVEDLVSEWPRGVFKNTSLCLSGFFSFLLSLTPVPLQAADYFWIYYYRPETHYSSAVDACKDVVGRAQGWRYTQTKLINQGSMAECWAEADAFPSQHGWWVSRTGDSCAKGFKFNESTGSCDAPSVEDKGYPEEQACASESINIWSGNVFESVTDYHSINKGLDFSRSYNSLDGAWRHNFSTRLLVTDSSVVLVTAQGKEYTYAINNSTVSANSTDTGRLEKTSNGWSYIAANNEFSTFNAAGRLIQKTSANGQQLKLAYSGSAITVTDQKGQSLSFKEDAQLQPIFLSAPGVTIQYNYNVNNRLVQTTREQGDISESIRYSYDDARNNALLTGITDQRGVRVATWTYDDQGRAISSQEANGAKRAIITYNTDAARRVTNELGKSTILRFVTAGGVKRLSAIEGEPSANCPSTNSSFTYNDRGQVLTQTDSNGFITTHAYNDRGLETSRTEASGTPQARTTTTTWHATFNLPLSITKSGQKTAYTYDAQGRQTSRIQTAF